MTALQPLLDEITQNTRKLVQPERLALSETLIAELFATDIEENTARQGSMAPVFTLPNSTTGKAIHSTDLLAVGPLIVKFFRGRWDPYCVTELEAWSERYSSVRERGALLVAVSPQTLRQGDFMVQHYHFPFPLLRDQDCALAADFGIAYTVTPAMQRYYRSILVNLAFINDGRNVMAADEGRTSRLPLPATFVLSQDGSILFAEAHADHRVRPEPEDVLAVL